MELRIWATAIASLAGLVLVLWGIESLIRTMRGRAASRPADPRRRSVSGAAFALQQVFHPGTEHVVRADREGTVEEDDDSGEGDWEDPLGSLPAELLASLGRTPVDPEEVRRLLARAARGGLDWRALYDSAVRAELDARPFRAPSLPPLARVAPRGG